MVKLLTVELEKSLEDELGQRRYCTRLETELGVLKSRMDAMMTTLHKERRVSKGLRADLQALAQLVGLPAPPALSFSAKVP